jgi:hypothetical protein
MLTTTYGLIVYVPNTLYTFFCKYILYIETPSPNTNRHVHAHKCLHCAGIEPTIPCVVGEYSHYYAKSTVFFV